MWKVVGLKLGGGGNINPAPGGKQADIWHKNLCQVDPYTAVTSWETREQL